LFPGRLDTQLGNQEDPEGEWAVEAVVGHSGSRRDSLFRVKWRAGDVTWMPYYQVSHLDALASYLDLLGVQDIADLPMGTSAVASEEDEPQKIQNEPKSLNSQTYKDSHSSSSFRPTPRSTSSPDPSAIALISPLTLHLIDLDNMPDFDAIPPLPIQHANFHRISKENFTLHDPQADINYNYHAMTIKGYILHNEKLQLGQASPNISEGGYDSFVALFNDPSGLCTTRFATIHDTLATLANTIAPSLLNFNIRHET
ncbi:hypothetical protein H0H92_014884, partial [Tricholoma furcatifolium]